MSPATPKTLEMEQDTVGDARDLLRCRSSKFKSTTKRDKVVQSSITDTFVAKQVVLEMKIPSRTVTKDLKSSKTMMATMTTLASSGEMKKAHE